MFTENVHADELARLAYKSIKNKLHLYEMIESVSTAWCLHVNQSLPIMSIFGKMCGAATADCDADQHKADEVGTQVDV